MTIETWGELPDELELLPGLVEQPFADVLLAHLARPYAEDDEPHWQQLAFAGTPHPRREALLAVEPHLRYVRYGGGRLVTQPFTGPLVDLLELVRGVESRICVALLFRYDAWDDSVSRHQDIEDEMGADPFVLAITLGQERAIDIARSKGRKPEGGFAPGHGDAYLMRGAAMTEWFHGVPKLAESFEQDPRIVVSFRAHRDHAA